MAGWTNRGKFKALDIWLRAGSAPTSFRAILCTNATAPEPDVVAFNSPIALTEIPAGNGYTSGGLTVERSATGFPTLAEVPASTLARVTMKQLGWTASTGTLPSSGTARYLVITDEDGVTGDVYWYYDIGERSVTIDNTLQITGNLVEGVSGGTLDLTVKGMANMLDVVARGAALKTNYYVALCTDAVTPTATISTLSELTEIAAGNGYTTGGFQLTPNATDFDTINRVDAEDLAECFLKDVAWTATGGALPVSGSGMRWAVLTDDNGTVGNREVYAFWDLDTSHSVPIGEQFKLVDFALRGVE